MQKSSHDILHRPLRRMFVGVTLCAYVLIPFNASIENQASSEIVHQIIEQRKEKLFMFVE